MLFKKLRSHSKSSSQSTKPDLNRVTSVRSSTFNGTACSKIPEVVISPPESENFAGDTVAQEADESRDYQEFLKKARRDEERAQAQKLKQIKKAREVNLSPWANKM